jgi:hypothetical protein
MPLHRTILFLGAGASRALGYPLTAEILPEILRRLKDGDDGGGFEKFIGGLPLVGPPVM